MMSDYEDSVRPDKSPELSSRSARRDLMRSLLDQMEKAEQQKRPAAISPTKPSNAPNPPLCELSQLMSDCLLLEQRLQRTSGRLASSERRAAQLQTENDQLAELALRRHLQPDATFSDRKPPASETESPAAAAAGFCVEHQKDAGRKGRAPPPPASSIPLPLADCSRLLVELAQAEERLRTVERQRTELERSLQEERAGRTLEQQRSARLQRTVDELGRQLNACGNLEQSAAGRLERADRLAERRLEQLQRAEQRLAAGEEQRRRLQASLDDGEEQLRESRRQLDKLLKANVTNENLILWLNKQLTTLQARHTAAYGRPRKSTCIGGRWPVDQVETDVESEPEQQPEPATGPVLEEPSDSRPADTAAIVKQLQRIRQLTNGVAGGYRATGEKPEVVAGTFGGQKEERPRKAQLLKKIEAYCESAADEERALRPEESAVSSRALYTLRNSHALDPFRCTVGK